MFATPSHFSMTGHVWLPLAVFVLAVFVLEFSTLDLWLADRIYAFFGGAWSWRDAWVTRTLIHDDGRALVEFITAAVLLVTLASGCVTRLRPFIRGFVYLLASALICGLAISLLKEVTHIDCPWDLLRYGGEYPYVRNFEPHPGTFRYGICFPAGHASAAYAWLGLYYFAREYAPRWKWRLLIAVLVMGAVFGIGQQLRGAHFLSHDVWTLGVCWLLATGIYLLAFRYRSEPVQSAGGHNAVESDGANKTSYQQDAR